MKAMAIASMTTGSLTQQGQGEPEHKPLGPALTEDRTMGRMTIGPKIPAAVLEKVGLKVGDTIPEGWDEDQVARWHRRGYLVVDGGKARETAQKPAGETRAAAPKK